MCGNVRRFVREVSKLSAQFLLSGYLTSGSRYWKFYTLGDIRLHFYDRKPPAFGWSLDKTYYIVLCLYFKRWLIDDWSAIFKWCRLNFLIFTLIYQLDQVYKLRFTTTIKKNRDTNYETVIHITEISLDIKYYNSFTKTQ